MALNNAPPLSSPHKHHSQQLYFGVIVTHHGSGTPQPSPCAKRRSYHPACPQGHGPFHSSVHPEDRGAFACWQMGNSRQASLGLPPS